MFNKSSFFLFIIVKLYIKFLIIQNFMKEKGALQDTPFIMYIKNFVFTLYLPILYYPNGIPLYFHCQKQMLFF